VYFKINEKQKMNEEVKAKN